MTRVLFVAAFDDALHAHAGLRARALERLGCHVTRFDFGGPPGLLDRFRGGDPADRFARLLDRTGPDLVVVVPEEDLSAGFTPAVRGPDSPTWVLLVPDLVGGVESVEHLAAAYDEVFTTGTDLAVQLAAKAGRPAHYLPPGCDPSVHRPMRSRDQYRANVVFAGTATPRRERLLAELVEFGLAVWGPGWRRTSLRDYCRGEQLATGNFVRAYAGASVAVNIHRTGDGDRQAAGQGVNQRLFELAAIGVPQVVDARADLDRHFRDREEVLVYRDPAELRALVKSALEDHTAAAQVAEAARRRALGEHTYMHRMRDLLGMVGRT